MQSFFALVVIFADRCGLRFLQALSVGYAATSPIGRGYFHPVFNFQLSAFNLISLLIFFEFMI